MYFCSTKVKNVLLLSRKNKTWRNNIKTYTIKKKYSDKIEVKKIGRPRIFDEDMKRIAFRAPVSLLLWVASKDNPSDFIRRILAREKEREESTGNRE